MKSKQMNNINDTGAAIVCEHIALEKLPILYAKRDEPLSSEDSGWQFLCNSGKEENEEKAQVWAISEVLALEPSLVEYIEKLPGTMIFRKNINDTWTLYKE